MDFYITRYQGKPMEALTPLFMTTTRGIHRLEKQEEQEEAAGEEKNAENIPRKNVYVLEGVQGRGVVAEDQS